MSTWSQLGPFPTPDTDVQATALTWQMGRRQLIGFSDAYRAKVEAALDDEASRAVRPNKQK
jgi:hypothetical protein